MSDNLLRVFPADPAWQPSQESAQAAERLLASLLIADGGSVDEIDVDFHDTVHVVDAGVNTTAMTCPACGTVSDEGFLLALLEDHPDGLETLDVRMPCCGRTVPLTVVRFDWPIGFARFELCAWNPVRESPWLDEVELRRVGEVLGHPVHQVLAHI